MVTPSTIQSASMDAEVLLAPLIIILFAAPDTCKPFTVPANCLSIPAVA